MQLDPSPSIRTMSALDDLPGALCDRSHAGRLLASVLAGVAPPSSVAIALWPGGAEVGASMAASLALPMEPLVARPFSAPWEPRLCLGAVAFDGTIHMDHDRIRDAGLTRTELEAAIERAFHEVASDEERCRGGRPFPSLARRPVILTDDGLSPLSVMCVAIAALENAGCAHVTVALPTGRRHELQRLAERASRVYCANLHHRYSADLACAYQRETASISPGERP